MRLVSIETMRDIEAQAMQDYGLDGAALMLNAARAVVRTLKSRWGPGSARTAIFCGKGNNAGDGWAVAGLLATEGWTVKVFHLGRTMELPPAAELYKAKALGQKIPEGSWSQGIAELNEYDLIVDALLGTGIRGEVSGELREVIDAMNRSGRPVLAVDIPSGVSGDTGQVAGTAVRARWTVTFGCAKLGLAVYPGRELAGEIVTDTIGLPEDLLADGDSFTLSSRMVGGYLPKRPVDTHKGRNGHLLVIGGSEGMTGAPVLSGTAALRAGAGLVTLGRREGLLISEKPAELISVTWREIQWDRYEALVFGPGLSMEEDGLALLEKVLSQTHQPRVIDADGLNLMAENGIQDYISAFQGNVILTPHPGEMARLCGLSTSQVQADRIRLTREKAKEWGAVLVLKGAATLVATPDGRLWVNTTGNPGMATAGTGDVLTGVIGALLVQGLSPERAAPAGVFLHGLAGDLAAREIGEIGLMAGDLLPCLPRALRSVMSDGTV